MEINKITFDAMAYNITRALSREQWFDWNAQQAQDWIEAQVMKRGFNADEAQVLGLHIMALFLQQRESN